MSSYSLSDEFRRVFFLAALVTSSVILTASPCLPEAKILALSPHWEGIKYEFSEGFNTARRSRGEPPVEFVWLDIGGTAEILRFVRSEFERSPDGIGIDILFGGGIDPFQEFTGADLLAPVTIDQNVIARIPKELNGAPLMEPKGRWYSPVLAGFGILCNKRVLERLRVPAPRSWRDLADPRFHSWLVSGDPGKSGSVHMAYEIILQAYGWESGWNLIFSLSRNIKDFPNTASQMAADVSSGEAACSFALDSQAWGLKQELGDEIIYFDLPEDYSTMTGDSVAAFKGAPNLKLASEFINYLLTPEAQRLWLQRKGSPGGPKRYNLFRLPALPDVYAEGRRYSPITLDPFSRPSKFSYNSELGTARWGLLNDMLRTLVIDQHKAIKAGFTPQLPFDEKHALELAASGQLKDQRIRNKILRAWVQRKDEPWLSALPFACAVLLSLVLLRKRVLRI